MLPRSFLGGYIGMFLSVCSILNAHSFPAARSYLWIDPPHCPRFTKLLQLSSRFGYWPRIRPEIRQPRGKRWLNLRYPQVGAMGKPAHQ
jgi:hypothetical protein